MLSKTSRVISSKTRNLAECPGEKVVNRHFHTESEENHKKLGIIYMFTQSCDFSVSVILNKVKDLANVSC